MSQRMWARVNWRKIKQSSAYLYTTLLGSVRQPASDIGNDGVGSHQRSERRQADATLRADGRAVRAAGALSAPDAADGWSPMERSPAGAEWAVLEAAVGRAMARHP